MQSGFRAERESGGEIAQGSGSADWGWYRISLGSSAIGMPGRVCMECCGSRVNSMLQDLRKEGMSSFKQDFSQSEIYHMDGGG